MPVILNLKTGDALSEGELEELRQLARWAQEEEARQSEGGQTDPSSAPNFPKFLSLFTLKLDLWSSSAASHAMNKILTFHPEYKNEFAKAIDRLRSQSALPSTMVDQLAARNAELENLTKPSLALLERTRIAAQETLGRMNPQLSCAQNEMGNAISKSRSQWESLSPETKRFHEKIPQSINLFANPDKENAPLSGIWKTIQDFKENFDSPDPPFSRGLSLLAAFPQKNDLSEERIADKVVQKIEEKERKVIPFPPPQVVGGQAELAPPLVDEGEQTESGSTQPVATFQDRAKAFLKRGVWLNGQELIPRRSKKALRAFLILYKKFLEAWEESLSRGYFVSPKPISLKNLDELLRKKDSDAELEDPEASTRKLLHRLREKMASAFDLSNLDGVIRLFPAYGYPEEAGYALTEAAVRFYPGPSP